MTNQTAAAPQAGQVATIASLRNPAANLPDVSAGFGSLKSFELMQRMAGLLCASTLVPVQYRSVVEKLDKYGNVKERKENPNALANAVVALNMAQRMGADPLMIMQNLYVIEGRPSWSSQFIVAAINGCGRFSPLRFTLKELGQKSVEYIESYWENNHKLSRTVTVDIADIECVAWALELGSGERLESPPVTIELAVKEGWLTKNGSKWQTMPQVMLRYRSASFFGKLYAPELLMGLRTVEEEQDIIEVSPVSSEVLAVTTESLRAGVKQVAAEPEPTPQAEPEPAPEKPATKKEKKADASAPTQKPAPEPVSPANVKEPLTVQTEEAPPHPSGGEALGETPTPQTKNDIQDQAPPKISPVVQKFMREINQASEKGSIGVDQWRAKHHQRVARDCGGTEHPDYLHIMDYAQMTYQACADAEKEQR